jgi:hypothetical protein
VNQYNPLALPGAISKTSLILPANLSYEEWEDIGKRITGARASLRWWLGDWINFGEAAFGEIYAQALDETNYSYPALRNIAYTARNIPAAIRSENLSFAHHTVVAPLEHQDKKALLDIAQRDRQTVAELRECVNNRVVGINTSKYQIQVIIMSSATIEVDAVDEQSAKNLAFQAAKKAITVDQAKITSPTGQTKAGD